MHITGKVQGVWYRASAKDKALALGLTGRVWNKSDGSVGAVVRGHEDKIDAFIAWCRNGPPLAKVNNVAVEESNDDLSYNGFEITREE